MVIAGWVLVTLIMIAVTKAFVFCFYMAVKPIFGKCSSKFLNRKKKQKDTYLKRVHMKQEMAKHSNSTGLVTSWNSFQQSTTNLSHQPASTSTLKPNLKQPSTFRPQSSTTVRVNSTNRRFVKSSKTPTNVRKIKKVNILRG